MVQFGDFILDSKQGRLLSIEDNKELVIEPKLLELLLLFLAKPNALISRHDLLEQLWAGSVVTDNAVNKLIGNLRKVLDDDAKNPRYIQTVPKRGYRLICDIAPKNIDVNNNYDKKSLNPVTPEDKKLTAKKLSFNWILSGFVLCILAIFSYQLWQIPNKPNNNQVGYSVALTRAQGIEFSPYMHPNNEHLYYLKESDEKQSTTLWIKNTNSSAAKPVNLVGSISKIVTVIEGNIDNTAKLIYLDESQNKCGVYQAVISHPSDDNQESSDYQKLFDCIDKRIKDIDYHKQQQSIYYTAQPKNFWPNQVYVFNLATKTHSTVTQPEPNGWGHHNIDISPDGEKLLIMSTDSDHKTQFLSLNLSSNKVIAGIKFNRPVYEAIWHHDSERVYYYSAPPANQIISSDFNGDNKTAIINVSGELSPQLSRINDGRNLLFNTVQKNYNHRWLTNNNAPTIENSNVVDISPVLFHHRKQYLFASKRSGLMQLYLADYQTEQVKIVSNFNKPFSLGYMSVSSDNKSILLSMNNNVYHLPVSELNHLNPLRILKQEHLMYTSSAPIIALDWFATDAIAITIVNNATPELVVINLSGEEIKAPTGNWGYGLTDSEQPNEVYLIEQMSNALYRAEANNALNSLIALPGKAINTQLVLPDQFYHAKIDSNTLYFVTTEKEAEYLHAIPLNNNLKSSKFKLNAFSSYDVSGGKIMVSDMGTKEGDIHRTMH